MHKTKTLSPKKIANLQTLTKFAYHGRITPVVAIKNFLTEIYGGNHLDPED